MSQTSAEEASLRERICETISEIVQRAKMEELLSGNELQCGLNKSVRCR